MSEITLTIKEIKDLAQMAGLILTDESVKDQEDDDGEITIAPCPPSGVYDEEKLLHCRLIAYYTEYPDEGCVPLGNEIDAKEGA